MSRWTNAVPGIENKVYLELGVFRGTTFAKIKARKKYGVDIEHKTGTHCMPSDLFFDQWKDFGLEQPDIVYIDACHEFDAVLRDYRNSVRILAPGGTIFAHDLIPPFSYYTSCEPGMKSLIQHCRYNNAYQLLYWVLLDNLRWAPGCFSNAHDYGCTYFPNPKLPPDEVPIEVRTATWEQLIDLLRPEHKLTDEQFGNRIAGRKGHGIEPVPGLDPLVIP